MAVAPGGCLEEDIEPLKVGIVAPPFTLTLLDGGTADMERANGNGHVLTFMASWCPCSNDSIPLMKKAHARYEAEGIEFLMIGIQDAGSKFEKFVDKWELPFPAGYDSGDRIAHTYGVTAPPTTIFIDREGKVKRVFYGNIKDKEEEFFQWTEELL
nr:TlpA family protein disulfide reductase [Desulfuromonadales bacterium]